MNKVCGLLIVALVLLVGVCCAQAQDNDFYAKYDKDAECFMSLDYLTIEGDAPRVWIAQGPGGYDFGRNYIRLDGKLWRDRIPNGQEALPCFINKTTSEVWYCPEVAAVAPAKVTPKTFVVYFDFDKDELTPDAIATLEDAAEYAIYNAGVSNIALASYCDFRGSEEYNKDLGQRRLDVVKAWLLDAGVPEPTMAQNNGDLKSLVHKLVGKFCPDCHLDRRTEITVQ